MTTDERAEQITKLKEDLRKLEACFEQEMRARGFDPAQAENVALPTLLARLYSEREETRAELEEMQAEE